MKRFMMLLLAFGLCLTAVTAQAKSHEGLVTLEFDLSAQPAGEEARLWIPYPVSDGDQEISSVHWSGDYAEAAIYTERRFGNPLLYARWPKEATSRKLTLRFHAKRQEIRHPSLPTKEAAWDKADYQPYLEATSFGPVDGDVKKLAEQITKGKKGVLAKARAIYDWVSSNMYRDPNTRGCGLGDVPSLLNSLGGKCADIHSVYVALARAAGVPAREVFGLRLGKKDGDDITGGHHCWAEFFLPGYGWVPVDPGDVRKGMLTEQLTLESPRTAELRSYFWGGVDPYRIKLSTGRDLTLTPAQQGAPVNYLMYPFAQIGGKTLDWLDPSNFKYSIRFNTL